MRQSNSRGTTAVFFLLIAGMVVYILPHRPIPAAAQTVTNGQQIVPYSATMAFDTNYTSAAMTMTGNVSSYTIGDGRYGAQVFHLSVCQGAGGPWTVLSQPANVSGVVGPLKATGCTYFRMIWDVPSQMWISSIIGSQPAGYVAEYGTDGKPLTTYSCTLVQGASTVTGTFSMTFTANPTWTNPSSVFVRGQPYVQSGTAGTPSTSYVAYTSAVSTTGVSGFVKSGTTLGVLGATIVAGNVAMPVTAEVCGW